jgi:hypothetical protein
MRVMLTGFFVVDIIAYNLDRIPQPGEIVRTDYFYVSTGGHPLNIGIDLVELGLSGSSVFVCGSVADLLPALKGRGFLLVRGGLGLHPLSLRVQSRAGSPARYPYPNRDSGLCIDYLSSLTAQRF